MDLIASAGMRNLDWAAHMRIDRFLRSCSVPPPSDLTSFVIEIAERIVSKAVLRAARPWAQVAGSSRGRGVETPNHEPPFYKARAGQARQVTRG